MPIVKTKPKMKKIKLLYAWAFLLGAIWAGEMACTSSLPREVEITFYHWHSQFDLDSTEYAYLKNLSSQQLYVRFFDVDWNPSLKKALPIGQVQLSPHPKLPEIIPTIFITNRTFLQIEDSALKPLAQNVLNKIQTQYAKLKTIPLKELQIDCDWSEKSRYNFFRFLELLQEMGRKDNIQISATIRLHQLRYPQVTGLPPIQRGTLMFYNMGEVAKMETTNSILDLDIAQAYLEQVSPYPIQLDIALPLFSWGVVFRQKRLVNLLSQITLNELADTSKFLPLDQSYFKVKKNHYQNSIYLYKNDLIRWEEVSLNDLKTSARILRKYTNRDSLRLTFYHLDSPLIQNFTQAELASLAKMMTHN